MKIQLIRTDREFEFRFPESPERCENALFFDVGLGAQDKFESVVAFTAREAHGKKRRRIHVGLKEGNTYRSLVQFEGTDDYDHTGDCVWIMKKPENNQQIPITEPIPLAYAGHRVVIIERYIDKGGGDHWGILVNEGELDDMIRVGLIRAGHKGYKEAP